MKLLQLNVWLGRLSPQILELIQHESPDIITAQEIYRGGDTVQSPNDMCSLYEQIAEHYPYHHFSAAHATRIAHSTVEMGNAIFSKYPIIQASDHFTSGAYVADLTKESAIENSRTLQTAILAIGQHELTVMNHHGYWDKTPLGNDRAVEIMRTIANNIENDLHSSRPLIFAGDFNIVPESPAMRAFDGLLKELTVKYGIRTTLSTLRSLGDIPCDHVLINDEIKDTHLYTLDTIVSDHKPLILEFELVS